MTNIKLNMTNIKLNICHIQFNIYSKFLDEINYAIEY